MVVARNRSCNSSITVEVVVVVVVVVVVWWWWWIGTEVVTAV